MDPRKLRQWRQLNEVDYAAKLSDQERQWLHQFNAEHFKSRPREDALDRAKDELTERIKSGEPQVYQGKHSYWGVTVEDLKIYLRIEREGISERALSRELSIPRSTLKHRLKLVEIILAEISWSNLFGNLDGEEINDPFI